MPDRVEQAAGEYPPPGTVLYFGNERGQPCGPADSYMWTWEGGPFWYYTADRACPPWEYALGPRKGFRCSACGHRTCKVAPIGHFDGSSRLHLCCASCEHVGRAVKAPPGNPDLLFRVAQAPPA